MGAVALPFLDDRPNVPLAEMRGDWIRSGSCDQCAAGEVKGECCTKMGFPISKEGASNPDVVRYFNLHGVEVKWFGDMPLAIVPLRCSALLDNGDCSLFGSPDRPELCSSGPFNAWAGQLMKHCSYQFEYDPGA